MTFLYEQTPISRQAPHSLPDVRGRLNEQLLAAAPKTLTRDINLLLSTLTQKAKAGEVSPQVFVGALRYLQAFANKPEDTFSRLVEKLRKAEPFGPLLLEDPNSPAAKALAMTAAAVALRRFENGALAHPSNVETGLRILSFAKENGLLEPGVSPAKIRTVLQPPIREALEQFVKKYGADPKVNERIKAGGQQGTQKATPLQTLLEDYR